MQRFHSLFVVLATTLLAVLALLSACDTNDETPPNQEVYGQYVPMGNGRIRSFIRLDAGGAPTAVGFRFDRAALDGLPHEHPSFVLDLPAQKAQTPYDHISVDWAPHGHEPNGIYDVPHFDMHFYMLSPAQRAAIQPGAAMQRLPAPEFMPKSYFQVPGEGVPQMGKHWGDATAPELQGKPFTTTFVYGSYDGNVVFHEPMITRAYLLTQPDTTIAIAQPALFARPGLRYPTHYRILFDKSTNVYTVALENLSAR